MWIVLDPEPDKMIADGFNEAEDAVAWIAGAIELAGDDADRIALLQRCVVAPFDPGRDAA